MSRSQTRAMLFAHFSGSHSTRVEGALILLSRQHRDVLFQAHGGGDRASVKWDAEREAVEKLGEALDLMAAPIEAAVAA